MSTRFRSVLAASLLGTPLVLVSGPRAVAAQVDGAAVYEQWCAGCHGTDGDGLGVAAGTMLPPPRDFTTGLYQIRTTATGELPTDEDILRVIELGMPGTAMPPWEDVLSAAERRALVEHLKGFSRFFASSPAPEPFEFGSAPRATDERIADGRRIYDDIECYQCHGTQGRGDGNSSSTLQDDFGFPIAAADLTENWRFNGGGTVEDIYRTLRTGLDGTPMPNFNDLIDGGVITDDELWSLAQFVRSLAPAEEPEVREVIVAARVEGELPSTLDDPAWDGADRFYVPLAGQIILAPRRFDPRVDGLWVRALHDAESLALLVSWTDPSMSPDPEWAEYAEQVVAVLGGSDEGGAQGPAGPDQLTIQFPQTLPTGMERPFFLQGDARRPAYMWSWRSDADGAVESVARGMGTAQPQEPAAQQVTAVAAHADGEWRVLLRRSLSTGDPDDLPFAVDQVPPIAFQAWDGDNGESGLQGAVSTWYFLSLEPETPVTVYVAPAAALFLTFGFGLLVVSRARKEEVGDGDATGPATAGGDPMAGTTAD